MCGGPKDMFPMITHVLSVSEIQGLRDLCICHIFNFPKVVREFIVYLVVG